MTRDSTMADEDDSQPFPQSLRQRFIAAANEENNNNDSGNEDSVSFYH